MIDLYTWPTPNGIKISIALEEFELPYTAHAVDISAGEQFSDEFIKISPASKIPAIVDHSAAGGDPLAVFESGAILLYLAEKTGRLISEDPHARLETIEWLMYQLSAVGPMLGQLGHFKLFATETIQYGIDRYTKESMRMLGTLDTRLRDHEFLAGDYSIADIATFPWIRSVYTKLDLDLSDFEALERWFETIAARPAVQRGLEVPSV